jgi:hypothetical protein
MAIDKNKQKQAHGLTHEEMQDLHYKQIQGDIQKVPANNAGDKIGDKYFKEEFADYEVPVYEKHLYHVVSEPRSFNPATGEKTSVASLKKFTKKAYEFQKVNHGFDGHTVHILHNPELEDVKAKKDLKQLNQEVEEDFEEQDTNGGVVHTDEATGNPETATKAAPKKGNVKK